MYSNYILSYTNIFEQHEKEISLKVASEILLNGLFITIDLIKFRYSLVILETIETKLYKPEQARQKNGMSNCICMVKFDNKAIKLI